MRSKRQIKSKKAISRRTILLEIAFAGTHYDGWQSQKTNKTLQELFESILLKIFSVKTNLHSSSRTDKGVHAKMMMAHFECETKLPDDKIKDALNYYLPDDVTVLSIKTMPKKFHARFDTKSKVYEYRLWNSRTKPVYDVAPYVLWCPYPLNLAAIKKASKVFIGKHDFSAFRDSGDDERNPVRTIHDIVVRKKGDEISILFKGDGFLRHMIRVIVGTLLEVGRGRKTAPEVAKILSSKDRRLAGSTAGSKGLTLLSVQY